MSLLEIHEPGETPLPHAGEGTLAVGIDLGTTNSVVAIAREGKPAALHDEAGRALVPSVVAYPAAGGVLHQLGAMQRLAFFCAFGERSAMAVNAAKDAGLANTAHIEGGMDAWKKAGGPVVQA